MTAGEQDDDRPRQRRAAPTGVRLLLIAALTIFAIALTFVLIYTTDIPWPGAVLISIVLAGGQAYGLRRYLSRGDGDGTRV